MLPRFENGIKLLLLLFLTNVSSRSNSFHRKWDRYLIQQKQFQNDQDQTERLQSNRDQSERNVDDRDQTEQISANQDQSERSLSNRDQSDRDAVQWEDIISQLDKSKSKSDNYPRAYSDRGSFLSRLLNSRHGPVVVFLTPESDVELESQKSDVKSSDTALAEFRADDEIEEAKYVPAPGENDAYVLYNILRTTQEDEDLDSEANEVFEKTKDTLRSAFALRCGARQTCEQKCPEKKPECPKDCVKVEKKVKNECERKCAEKQRHCKKKCEKVIEKKVNECEKKIDECQEEAEEECESKCQQVFDELDACPKPTSKPKNKFPHGKTMPPRWLLRALNQL